MPSTPVVSVRPRTVLVAALVLTGLSMRTAVTSVGAALDDLQADLPASGGMAGIITTLPVICFAAFGALTPRLTRLVGPHRLLVVALAATTVGLATRPFAGSAVLFALISVAALAGSAVSNVLMPSLVKLHFPDRVGAMTAVYTTALAIGITLAAGLTVPIGDAADDWRVGLAAWAVVSALAIVPWLPSLSGNRSGSLGTVRMPLGAMLHSRTAWALAIFFGTQSMQAYITFGWFARFLTDHGVGSGRAGLMLAVLSALSIPVSLVVPRIPPALHRATVGFFAGCLGLAYTLMATVPASTAWLWIVLAGLGAGSFPLALTLIATRGRTAETTATLSAFVQAIGYVIAGTGPLLFGAFYGWTDSWALPITLLFVALAAMVAAAVPSTTPRFVDDEVAASPR